MTGFITSICAAAIVYAVSILYAAIGEIFSQRAGIMNLGIEGIMLMGAVSGFLTVYYTNNLVLAMAVRPACWDPAGPCVRIYYCDPSGRSDSLRYGISDLLQRLERFSREKRYGGCFCSEISKNKHPAAFQDSDPRRNFLPSGSVGVYLVPHRAGKHFLYL